MTHPMKERVHEFRIIVIGGMLLSLNCGFMNAVTLLDDPPRTTTHLTGSATRFGIAIANLDFHDFYFYGGFIVVYVCGSAVAGSLTPSKKFSVSNGYGRVLLLSSILILISSLIAILSDRNLQEFYDMTVAASAGMQNGMLSRYSGNIIRVGHVTGGCVDIGVHLGRYAMGNTENVWKIKILLALVFSFWLGGVLVKWIDPLLGSRILLVNVGYMVCIATTYMVYWHVMGLDRLHAEKESGGDLEDRNDSALNINVSRENSEASFSSTTATSVTTVTATQLRDSLVYEDESDSDFNLSQQDAERLHVSILSVTQTQPQTQMGDGMASTRTSVVIPPAPTVPVLLQDRDAKEFSFIMIGASLLALNAGCINAIAALASRGLFVSHVSGSVTSFALTAFSFDDPTGLKESLILVSSFTFGAFLVGLMSSTSVFRLGISYGRVLCLASLFFIAASITHLLKPGTMYFYCFAAMGCGVQNGMITKYSGGVIRTTNVTGGFADIGGIIGRMMKGNYSDVWQLKVLLPLVCSFILGGTIGSFLSDALGDYAPVVNAVFMVIVCIVYIVGVKHISGTELSYSQLITGKYTYPEIKALIRDTMARGNTVIRDSFVRHSSTMREDSKKDEDKLY